MHSRNFEKNYEGYRNELIQVKNDIKNVVVGKILEIKKHEDSDHLVITQIDLGNEKVQIVTGAKNKKEGDTRTVISFLLLTENYTSYS